MSGKSESLRGRVKWNKSVRYVRDIGGKGGKGRLRSWRIVTKRKRGFYGLDMLRMIKILIVKIKTNESTLAGGVFEKDTWLGSRCKFIRIIWFKLWKVETVKSVKFEVIGSLMKKNNEGKGML